MKTDQIQAFNENYEKWLQTDNKSCTKLLKLRLFKFYKPKNPLLRFKSTKNQSFDSMQGKMLVSLDSKAPKIFSFLDSKSRQSF